MREERSQCGNLLMSCLFPIRENGVRRGGHDHRGMEKQADGDKEGSSLWIEMRGQSSKCKVWDGKREESATLRASELSDVGGGDGVRRGEDAVREAFPHSRACQARERRRIDESRSARRHRQE